MMLKLFIEKIQRRVSLSRLRRPDLKDDGFDGELEVAAVVPDDVKEGHFAVFAVKGKEPKRFVIELGYLTDPAFLMLLEQAEEEYGFKQKGALAVPCRPEDLQKILQDRRKKNGNANGTCKSQAINCF